ncbi:MAG: 50S ribosomal protein L11 methyltransferase [Anaerolineales bacterium]|nr:50S ribosomal protein L11 methyltransferase [Anaerolineales bacterium]
MSWLEISLTVDGELAEAVSEVLSRFAPHGVVIESTQIQVDAYDQGYPSGPLRVSAYLPLDDQIEDKRRSLEQALWHLGFIRSLPEPQYRTVEEADWAEAWKKHFHPIEIGNHLLVVPPWIDPIDDSKVVVRIDPGMAFGTGTHPSTQLCLSMISEWFINQQSAIPHADMTMIDVGCGSGILAIAALKLGFTRALGVDLDPQALLAARTNAEMNAVTESLELQVGSLSEILLGRFSLTSAPLVAANILAPVLVRMLADGLGKTLTPGGSLILAGILVEQAVEVITAALGQGLRLVNENHMGDWIALSFTN